MVQPWPDTEQEPEAARRLLEDLARCRGGACALCARQLCGHEVLFAIALGCKDAPRCLDCLAASLQRQAAELRDHLVMHFRGRDCYRFAWARACRDEGFAPSAYPPCLWPDGAPAEPGVLESLTPMPLADEPIADWWDAGDMACGDLVLALRMRMARLPPGAVLAVVARDPAAPEDLPAWCRLTGHRLARARHPDYLIQRKET